LSEYTVNIFDPPLTLSVIDHHLYLDHLVLEENELVHVGLDTYIVLGLHARETSFALHITFEVKLLIGMTFNGLAYDISQLVLLCISIIPLFYRLHV